ncbi:hypothetical protein GCK72_010862 [Caenorhabditis remanei]|uniref:Uncharacterized protein n=1 Tax=Caenorhabditis remanei TaxID=31234 RepID=A0A6A5H411_CAERE|nr:hypothetical protein GCK72_010862 [Caenorhabditis remanei]KAF1762600.1 hypothetical protein GCK72_010862 [Caenorhabditis remanei]
MLKRLQTRPSIQTEAQATAPTCLTFDCPAAPAGQPSCSLDGSNKPFCNYCPGNMDGYTNCQTVACTSGTPFHVDSSGNGNWYSAGYNATSPGNSIVPANANCVYNLNGKFQTDATMSLACLNSTKVTLSFFSSDGGFSQTVSSSTTARSLNSLLSKIPDGTITLTSISSDKSFCFIPLSPVQSSVNAHLMVRSDHIISFPATTPTPAPTTTPSPCLTFDCPAAPAGQPSCSLDGSNKPFCNYCPRNMDGYTSCQTVACNSGTPFHVDSSGNGNWYSAGYNPISPGNSIVPANSNCVYNLKEKFQTDSTFSLACLTSTKVTLTFSSSDGSFSQTVSSSTTARSLNSLLSKIPDGAITLTSTASYQSLCFIPLNKVLSSAMLDEIPEKINGFFSWLMGY